MELLAEVLPTGGDINVAGVYRNVQGVAERMEAELGEEKWQFIDGCQREWDTLPPPGPPLIVGLDGGVYPRQGPEVPRRGLVRSHRWQEHVRGRRSKMLCLRAELRHKAEAAVVRIDEVTRPPGQSAGDLPFRRCGRREGAAADLSPESEHWLDWFHVAMRLRVMGQMAKGLLNEQNMMSAQEPLTEPGEELDTVDIGKQLERVKWFLWHGNVGRALDTIDDVEAELDLLPVRHLPPELRAKTTFPGDQLLHGFPPV